MVKCPRCKLSFPRPWPPADEQLMVSCSRDVYQAYNDRLALAGQESFVVLVLNARNRILERHTVAKGGVNTVHVSPSDCVRPAIIAGAPSIILLHNHPSGDPSPSPEDRTLTTRIATAATLLGIRLLDHIIISRDSYYSFSDAGAL